ncbi:Ger(x)C family spore germination protein [Bacillus sp. V5-8f]|uniref:Ger(x)C family spore germination protein n=1 Tax=Bacillus sp. V5-8f TaxID=2053044 RepID=UPI000C781FA2|nr:Ger(x)C family spore germination protein [Bacillus sp. V5-8f]PLT32903.1 hypothetical protein CUU64_15800 [Bacillus sp. V5-8f]
MDKYRKWLILLILLTGCGDQRILEDQAMVQTITYDLAGKQNGMDQIQVSAALPLAKKEESQKIISTKAKSMLEAQMKASEQTDWDIVHGQLRTVLFGKSVAKKGLSSYCDTLERDPSVGHRTHIMITNGNAAKMLFDNYQQQKGTYEYIDQLIEKESKNNRLPEINSYQFMRDLYDDGIDPVAPQLVKKKKHVEVDGIALFRDDHYITYLDSSMGPFYMLLTKTVKKGRLTFTWEGGKNREAELLTFSITDSDQKIDIKRSVRHPFALVISVNVKGTVLEYMGEGNIANPNQHSRIEKKMEKHLKEKMKKVVAFTQKHRVDSLGIGKVVRNSLNYEEWNKLNWRETYSNIPITIHTDVQLRDYGRVN